MLTTASKHAILMPPEHQKYVQWNGEQFIRWAGKVGSNTQVAVQAILSNYKVEQQGYKSCVGLMKLTDKYTPERLENACGQAWNTRPALLLRISRPFWHPVRIKPFPSRVRKLCPPPSTDSPVELSITEGGTSNAD